MLHIWRNTSIGKGSIKEIKRERPREYRERRWSSERIEYVIKNYHKMTQKELAEALGTTVYDIANIIFKIRQNGGLKERKSRKLTEEEISFIKENIGAMSVNQMAKKLGRHHCVIFRFLDRMEKEGAGVTRVKQREWTEEEHDYIIANYRKKTGREIARDLNVSPEDISNRVRVLRRRGLLKKRKSPKFTKREIKYIKENKDALSGSEIARRLGRSYTNVIKHIREIEGR